MEKGEDEELEKENEEELELETMNKAAPADVSGTTGEGGGRVFR